MNINWNDIDVQPNIEELNRYACGFNYDKEKRKAYIKTITTDNVWGNNITIVEIIDALKELYPDLKKLNDNEISRQLNRLLASEAGKKLYIEDCYDKPNTLIMMAFDLVPLIRIEPYNNIIKDAIAQFQQGHIHHIYISDKMAQGIIAKINAEYPDVLYSETSAKYFIDSSDFVLFIEKYLIDCKDETIYVDQIDYYGNLTAFYIDKFFRGQVFDSTNASLKTLLKEIYASIKKGVATNHYSELDIFRYIQNKYKFYIPLITEKMSLYQLLLYVTSPIVSNFIAHPNPDVLTHALLANDEPNPNFIYENILMSQYDAIQDKLNVYMICLSMYKQRNNIGAIHRQLLAYINETKTNERFTRLDILRFQIYLWEILTYKVYTNKYKPYIIKDAEVSAPVKYINFVINLKKNKTLFGQLRLSFIAPNDLRDYFPNVSKLPYMLMIGELHGYIPTFNAGMMPNDNLYHAVKANALMDLNIDEAMSIFASTSNYDGYIPCDFLLQFEQPCEFKRHNKIFDKRRLSTCRKRRYLQKNNEINYNDMFSPTTELNKSNFIWSGYPDKIHGSQLSGLETLYSNFGYPDIPDGLILDSVKKLRFAHYSCADNTNYIHETEGVDFRKITMSNPINGWFALEICDILNDKGVSTTIEDHKDAYRTAKNKILDHMSFDMKLLHKYTLYNWTKPLDYYMKLYVKYAYLFGARMYLEKSIIKFITDKSRGVPEDIIKDVISRDYSRLNIDNEAIRTLKLTMLLDSYDDATYAEAADIIYGNCDDYNRRLSVCQYIFTESTEEELAKLFKKSARFAYNNNRFRAIRDKIVYCNLTTDEDKEDAVTIYNYILIHRDLISERLTSVLNSHIATTFYGDSNLLESVIPTIIDKFDKQANINAFFSGNLDEQLISSVNTIKEDDHSDAYLLVLTLAALEHVINTIKQKIYNAWAEHPDHTNANDKHKWPKKSLTRAHNAYVSRLFIVIFQQNAGIHDYLWKKVVLMKSELVSDIAFENKMTGMNYNELYYYDNDELLGPSVLNKNKDDCMIDGIDLKKDSRAGAFIYDIYYMSRLCEAVNSEKYDMIIHYCGAHHSQLQLLNLFQRYKLNKIRRGDAGAGTMASRRYVVPSPMATRKEDLKQYENMV